MPTGTTLLLVAIVSEGGKLFHLAPPGRPWRPLAVALLLLLGLHLGLFPLGPKALPVALAGLFFLYTWTAQPEQRRLVLSLAMAWGLLLLLPPSALLVPLIAILAQTGGTESAATAGTIGGLALWSLGLGAHPGVVHPVPFDFVIQTLLLSAALGRVRGLLHPSAGPGREEAHVNP